MGQCWQILSMHIHKQLGHCELKFCAYPLPDAHIMKEVVTLSASYLLAFLKRVAADGALIRFLSFLLVLHRIVNLAE